MLCCHQFLPHLHHCVYPPLVGLQLCLEVLVLLDLGLQVAGVLVSLVPCHLDLLADPVPHLVCVTQELLQNERVLKLRASLLCLAEQALFRDLDGFYSRDYLVRGIVVGLSESGCSVIQCL